MIVLIKILRIGVYSSLPLTLCKQLYSTLNCLGLRQLNPQLIAKNISNTVYILSVHRKKKKKKRKALQKTNLTANSHLITFLYVDVPSILVNSLQLDCRGDILASIRKGFIYSSCFHIHCHDSRPGAQSVREAYYSNIQM